MPATTFEQIIANHADMIARLDHQPNGLGAISISDFIDVIADLGNLLSTGMTSALQAAGHELTMAADYLTEALRLPGTDPAKTTFISTADQRLNNVDALALA